MVRTPQNTHAMVHMPQIAYMALWRTHDSPARMPRHTPCGMQAGWHVPWRTSMVHKPWRIHPGVHNIAPWCTSHGIARMPLRTTNDTQAMAHAPRSAQPWNFDAHFMPCHASPGAHATALWSTLIVMVRTLWRTIPNTQALAHRRGGHGHTKNCSGIIKRN